MIHVVSITILPKSVVKECVVTQKSFNTCAFKWYPQIDASCVFWLATIGKYSPSYHNLPCPLSENTSLIMASYKIVCSASYKMSLIHFLLIVNSALYEYSGVKSVRDCNCSVFCKHLVTSSTLDSKPEDIEALPPSFLKLRKRPKLPVIASLFN